MYDPPVGAPKARGVKDCCLDSNNLVRQRIAADKVADVCRVCGCRHLKFFADPVNMVARAASVGGAAEPQAEPPEAIPEAGSFFI